MDRENSVPLGEVVDLDRGVISASDVSKNDGYVGLEDIEKETGRILSYRNPVEIGRDGLISQVRDKLHDYNLCINRAVLIQIDP